MGEGIPIPIGILLAQRSAASEGKVVVFGRMKQRLLNLSLFNRVLIGNSIVIVFGAVGGTLLTRQLTLMGNVGLILLFSSLGIFASLLVNYLIIKTALQPLQDVRKMVEQVEATRPRLSHVPVRVADPDIRRLVRAIQAMVGRLERRTRQLRALSERAIAAQEEERKRIARGLHDDTAQALAMLIINLERMEAALPDVEEELKVRLADARQLATLTLEDLRKIVFDLRPTILDDLGLIPAIRWYARFSLQPAGIDVSFEMPEDGARIQPHLETLLFRVAQEAVNNVLRHAGAGHVCIRLRKGTTDLRLEVEDDGHGFDVAAATGQAVIQKRLGLLGIQERVALVSGEVRIESSPGRGTRLQALVPLFPERGERRRIDA